MAWRAGLLLPFLGLALVVAGARSDQPDAPVPLQKKPAPDKAKNAPADEPDDDQLGPLPRLKKEGKEKKSAGPMPEPDRGPDAPPAPDQAKDLLERVAKNLEAAEDRLKNQDAGDQTRKIQGDVVKDLDELIKQKQQQQQQSSSSPSKPSAGSQGGQPQQSAGKSGRHRKKQGQQSAQRRKDQGGSQTKKESSTQSGQKKGRQKDRGQAAASKNGGGGDGTMKKGATVADLFRDVWGHLPESKRLEMDAYSRERFMPQYEDLLRQYYRTIAEQGRRKGE